MRRFEGRVAFVTGAAHGIGRAIAHRLSNEGASVALADLDVDAASEAAAELTDAAPFACDITDRAAVEAAVARAVERFGGLDVLVNNAGRGRGGAFAAYTDEAWAQQIELNLTGAVRCIQSALPHLLRSSKGGNGGNAVSIGSVNGISAFGDVAYSTAKAGLHNLVTNLTAEYGSQGLRFNVVAPATVRTRVWEGREAALDDMSANLYPLGRVGEPEDVAAAVAFLASEDARWVSGVVLPVDGGILSGPATQAFLRPEA